MRWMCGIMPSRGDSEGGGYRYRFQTLDASAISPHLWQFGYRNEHGFPLRSASKRQPNTGGFRNITHALILPPAKSLNTSTTSERLAHRLRAYWHGFKHKVKCQSALCNLGSVLSKYSTVYTQYSRIPFWPSQSESRTRSESSGPGSAPPSLLQPTW